MSMNGPKALYKQTESADPSTLGRRLFSSLESYLIEYDKTRSLEVKYKLFALLEGTLAIAETVGEVELADWCNRTMMHLRKKRKSG